MPKRTHAERRAAGRDVQRTLRGGQVGTEDTAAATEARFGALGTFAVDFAFGEVWSRDELSRRDRSLVVISVLATLNQLAQLRPHVQSGIHHGLTRTEIEEVFVQLSGYAGFPRAIDGLTTAHAALAELEGVDHLEAGPPAAHRDDEQRSELARAVLGRMTANQPPGGIDVEMGSFAASAGRFAFGDLWSRDELTPRERSLVVCSTLTTQARPSELRFHLQAALNNGATITDLEELMITVIVYAGFPTAVDGFRALREVEARQPPAR